MNKKILSLILLSIPTVSFGQGVNEDVFQNTLASIKHCFAANWQYKQGINYQECHKPKHLTKIKISDKTTLDNLQSSLKDDTRNPSLSMLFYLGYIYKNETTPSEQALEYFQPTPEWRKLSFRPLSTFEDGRFSTILCNHPGLKELKPSMHKEKCD